ncbi:hypothetical protein KY284_035729 [Solanum tuberosum]|nr:hypothetical protein KY284_035729 [Solanum tuberosum]
MSQSQSSPRKVLGTPNEINPVSFYLYSDAPSLMKVPTTTMVDITKTSCPTPKSPIDLNNPTPLCQPGPYVSMLSDCLFDGDLPESKCFESNILAASENIVIESLTHMREGLRNDAGSSFADDLLGSTEPIFDKTPDVSHSPSSDSDDTD